MENKSTKTLVFVCLAAVIAMAVLSAVSRRQSETDAVSVGIIGGADGPTSIFLAGKLGGDQPDGSGDEQEISVTADMAAAIDMEAALNDSYGMTVELDYVSAGKFSMHGSFGYLSFSLGENGAVLERAVTLEETGNILMQGVSYTEILGGKDGALILPEAYNPDVEKKKKYWYSESENRVTGGIGIPDEIMEKLAGNDFSDAPIDEQYRSAATERIKEKENSQLLYGPVAVGELDSNVYGFLAADGGKLKDIWYGLWWPDLEKLERIELFSE